MVGGVVSGAFVLVDWTDSPVVGELFFYPDSIDYLQMFSGCWYSENTSSLPVALWLLMLFTAAASFYSEILPKACCLIRFPLLEELGTLDLGI